jgi:hypothetical protein
VDVNAFGNAIDDRAVVNSVQTSLDEVQGTPYIQTDVRITRPFVFHDRCHLLPLIEIFNVFNPKTRRQLRDKSCRAAAASE